MPDTLKKQVIGSRCHYRPAMERATSARWRVEAQYLCCDAWATFTIADTENPPRPKPAERDERNWRHGDVLWWPINAQRFHPSIAWIDRLGNGGFEDNFTEQPWPMPTVPWEVQGATPESAWWRRATGLLGE